MARHCELRRWKQLSDVTPSASVSAKDWVVEMIETEPLEVLDDRLIEELDCMVVMLSASTLNDSRSCELLQAQLKSADNDLPVWFVLVHEAAWVEQSVVERIRRNFGSGFKLLHVRRGHHSDNARGAAYLGLTLGLVLGGGGAVDLHMLVFFRPSGRQVWSSTQLVVRQWARWSGHLFPRGARQPRLARHLPSASRKVCHSNSQITGYPNMAL